tara:strand:+ start:608 stop:916 length:309 start_codon:yes stop_codon:yes gene_type:complete
MKKISTKDILDGMILAEDLAGPNGNIILPKGVKLKSSLVSRLDTWGISEVCIEPTQDDFGTEGSQRDDHYEEELKALFISGTEEPNDNLLFQTLLKLHQGEP